MGLQVETKNGTCFEIVHIYENDVLTLGPDNKEETIINKGDFLILDQKTKNYKILTRQEFSGIVVKIIN